MYRVHISSFRSYPVVSVWIVNIFLVLCLLAVHVETLSFKSSLVEYSMIQADPYDGTTMPIAYVPDWLIDNNTDESLSFNSIPLGDFVEIPDYHESLSGSTAGTTTSRSLARYTFSTPYMGSYRMNHLEYDGSHLGVDIRSPLGTPVLSIANGVVVHADNVGASADGKFIVIRHDAPLNGTPTQLYSSYLHLSDVQVEAGDVVRRGSPIGAVGMTGNASAPHLHFQIDRQEAPFHAYWPYTLAEAQAQGLDFYSAINAGLGKEKAIRYTVNPIEFVYHDRVSALVGGFFQSAVWPEGIAGLQSTSTWTWISISTGAMIASSGVVMPMVSTGSVTTMTGGDTGVLTGSEIPTTAANTGASIGIDTGSIALPSATDVMTGTDSATPLGTGSVVPSSIDSTIPSIQSTGGSLSETLSGVSDAFSGSDTIVSEMDTALTSQSPAVDPTLSPLLQTKINALIRMGILQGQSYTPSSVSVILSRREALLMLARSTHVPADLLPQSVYRDVRPDEELGSYVEYCVSHGILSGGQNFRPDDSITRGEFVKLLVGFIHISVDTSSHTVMFTDVPADSAFAPYIDAFVHAIGGVSGDTFEPDRALLRQEAYSLIYAYETRSTQ